MGMKEILRLVMMAIIMMEMVVLRIVLIGIMPIGTVGIMRWITAGKNVMMATTIIKMVALLIVGAKVLLLPIP